VLKKLTSIWKGYYSTYMGVIGQIHPSVHRHSVKDIKKTKKKTAHQAVSEVWFIALK
jgi:hypothetical protein